MNRRVRGALGTVAAVCITLVLAACSGADSLSGQSAGRGETAVMRQYAAVLTLSADGDLHVVETLTVRFPVARHGIYRQFDTRAPGGPGRRLVPRDLRVTRDGAPDRVKILRSHGGRFVIVKVGRADHTFTGEHTYRIDYRIPGVLSTQGLGGHTDFSWQLIGDDWAMPIAGSTFTVHVPAPARSPSCAVSGKASDECTVGGEDTDTVTVTTGRLAPGSRVTLRLGLDIPTRRLA